LARFSSRQAPGPTSTIGSPCPEASPELLAGCTAGECAEPRLALSSVVLGALGELAADALRGATSVRRLAVSRQAYEQCRFTTVTASLSDLKAVRHAYWHTITDVVLAMISGGLGTWLQTRGAMRSENSLTVLVPTSVTEDDGEPTSLGSQVLPNLLSLPIGAPNALPHTGTGRPTRTSGSEEPVNVREVSTACTSEECCKQAATVEGGREEESCSGASEPLIAKMIFVPMTLDETAALRSGAGVNHHHVCVAAASLVASMETDTVMEEAEYAAISNAGVLAMVLNPNAPRLVVAAEVREEQVIDRGAPQGQVEVNGLTWPQVRALFADEPAARRAVRLARKTVVGRSLAAALTAPKVAAVLDKYPLMWYAPEELDQLWGRAHPPGDLHRL
jgi:hypothetical protein